MTGEIQTDEPPPGHLPRSDLAGARTVLLVCLTALLVPSVGNVHGAFP